MPEVIEMLLEIIYETRQDARNLTEQNERLKADVIALQLDISNLRKQLAEALAARDPFLPAPEVSK